MSRKWRDAPRDDFPSLSFPLYVFTVLWHRLNLVTAPIKNAPVNSDIALYQLFGRDYLDFVLVLSHFIFKVSKGTRSTW